MFRAAWEQLKCLLQRLMDSNDSSADSVVVCGIFATGSLALIQLVVIAINSIVTDPIPFDAMSYGMGAGAIVGAIAGGVGIKALAKRASGVRGQPPKDEEIQ